MRDKAPSIVQAARRVLLGVESSVRTFPRYHKYQVGASLRSDAFKVRKLAVRAWRDREHQAEWISRLSFAIDDLKETLQLAMELHAFQSFAVFEELARTLSDLGRQCGGWQKLQHPKGQNAGSGETPRRAQILSARGASAEANP